MRDLDWMADARCAQANPDLWHHDAGNGTYSEAARICRRCPVQRECADFAASIESDANKKDRHGLWAGETKGERAARSRRRAREARHEAILRLIERGGMNADQIAEHVGVAVRTVYRIKARREQMGMAS